MKFKYTKKTSKNNLLNNIMIIKFDIFYNKIKFLSVIFFIVAIITIFILKKNYFDFYQSNILKDFYNSPPKFLFDYKTIQKYNQENKIKYWKTKNFIIYQNFIWDLFRIWRIQYIWKNITRIQIPFFDQIMNFLCALKPNYQYWYIFYQLLWPISKQSQIPDKIKYKSWIDTVNFGEKWIFYTCKKDPKIKINCQSYQLPNFLAFNYFYYLKNLEKAIKYYEIASQQKDAPEITKDMKAIVLWNLNKHLKASILRFSKIPNKLKNNDKLLNQQYERYLKKSIFELSLYLINQAYNLASSNWDCIQNYKCLIQKQYLSKIIKKYINLCKNNSLNLYANNQKKSGSGNNSTEQNIFCQIFYLWLQNKWINPNWKLIYPLNSWLEYWRNPITESFWLVEKK